MLENRDDVKFLRTTLFDNPYLSKMEKQKILSYDPSNPINQKSGTADAFRWSVYGLGERAVCEGLVHPNVTWINEFPKHETLEIIGYGCDFGYTNSPTVIIKAGNIGRDLYVECLFYAPTPTINELLPVMRKYINANNYVTCDSADPIMISDLRRNGVNALGIKKVGDKEGFIKYGVDLVNRFNLHIVRNASVRKEQENRVWEMVGGVSLNRPKQGNDHFWDALTYCLVTDFRNVLERE
jgi:phage terminase large subunit